MGYLNTQLEKVASTVTNGMEKKAAKILSALGKAGSGVGKGIRGIGNHVGRHWGKYALGGGLAGLAGYGTYNYVNTGKIDPETGLPVLERDRAYTARPVVSGAPDAEEAQLYNNAWSDYQNKTGYYDNMSFLQKISPWSFGRPEQIKTEFYQHSGDFRPRQIEASGNVYNGESQPRHAGVEAAIARMSPEERAALDDPKVAAAVQASIAAQRPFARPNSPWRDEHGFNQVERRPDPNRPWSSGDIRFKHSNYYADAYPRIRPWLAEPARTNYDYNPSKYGLNR